MDDHTRSGPVTDFLVHLNCLSDANQYENTSSCFTNNMKPPILLPYHTAYEVGLSNIYFKQDFYQILANDKDSAIQVIFHKVKKEPISDKPAPNQPPLPISDKPPPNQPPSNDDDTSNVSNVDDNISNTNDNNIETNTEIKLSETHKLTILDQKIIETFYPSINLTDDIVRVLDEYNKQAETLIFHYDELNMKITPKFSDQYMVSLLDKHNLVQEWISLDTDQYLLAALKFGRVVGNYLGFYPNKPLFVKADPRLYFDHESKNSKVIKPLAGFGQEKIIPIANIFVYTNIVKRSRTGSQSSNLLEVVPFNTFSKNNSITIYKEVSQFDIQYIKIQLADEYGKNIPFLDNTYVAVDLHFRPKI